MEAGVGAGLPVEDDPGLHHLRRPKPERRREQLRAIHAPEDAGKVRRVVAGEFERFAELPRNEPVGARAVSRLATVGFVYEPPRFLRFVERIVPDQTWDHWLRVTLLEPVTECRLPTLPQFS